MYWIIGDDKLHKLIHFGGDGDVDFDGSLESIIFVTICDVLWIKISFKSKSSFINWYL